MMSAPAGSGLHCLPSPHAWSAATAGGSRACAWASYPPGWPPPGEANPVRTDKSATTTTAPVARSKRAAGAGYFDSSRLLARGAANPQGLRPWGFLSQVT